jgi:hypothetical protein
MTRRMALTTAGAITIVLLAAAAAIAANLGVLRLATDPASPGDLTATELAPAVTGQGPAGDRQATPEDGSGIERREHTGQPTGARPAGAEPGDDHGGRYDDD